MHAMSVMAQLTYVNMQSDLTFTGTHGLTNHENAMTVSQEKYNIDDWPTDWQVSSKSCLQRKLVQRQSVTLL